jgi:chromosome segregation ATPase
LRFRLRRERQKKENTLRQLGEKAWDGDIPLAGAESTRASLEEMVKKRDGAQMEWKNALTEMERLHKRLEESNFLSAQKIQERKTLKLPFDELLKRKREEERALKRLAPGGDIERQLEEIKRETAETVGRIEEFERQIGEIEAEKHDHQREIAREIHYWKKKKEKVQERIKEIEAQQQELYLWLGQFLEENRVESLELRELYSEVDLVSSRIATLERRVETLSGG